MDVKIDYSEFGTKIILEYERECHNIHELLAIMLTKNIKPYQNISNKNGSLFKYNLSYISHDDRLIILDAINRGEQPESFMKLFQEKKLTVRTNQEHFHFHLIIGNPNKPDKCTQAIPFIMLFAMIISVILVTIKWGN